MAVLCVSDRVRYMKETVKHYTVRTENPHLSLGGFRAVFLSDMHNCVWHNDADYLVSVISAEEPDIILCGGDMVIGHPACSKDNLEKAGRFIKKLSESYRIYYAFGNHEYRLKIYPEIYKDMYKTYMDQLKASDIVWLDNSAVRLSVNHVPVNICGLSISRKYYRRFDKTELPQDYICNAVGRPDRDAFNILLAHHPKYLGSYFRWGADLILCGHYHGGVMRVGGNKGLISPDPSIFPHNAYGMVQKNKKTAVISAGMGEHTIPLRFNNPREIVVLNIEIW